MLRQFNKTRTTQGWVDKDRMFAFVRTLALINNQIFRENVVPSNTNPEENYALEEQSSKLRPLCNKDKSTICQKQQRAMLQNKLIIDPVRPIRLMPGRLRGRRLAILTDCPLDSALILKCKINTERQMRSELFYREKRTLVQVMLPRDVCSFCPTQCVLTSSEKERLYLKSERN